MSPSCSCSCLNERLEEALVEDLRVAAQDELAQFVVGDVLEGAAEQDGEVLRRLLVQHAQLLPLLLAAAAAAVRVAVHVPHRLLCVQVSSSVSHSPSS